MKDTVKAGCGENSDSVSGRDRRNGIVTGRFRPPFDLMNDLYRGL